MSNDEIFAAAYREHYWAVSRYVARRMPGRADEVEEVVAEVFTVAWRRRRDLPDAPLPWLYGVARNCLANAVRGYGRRRRLVDRLGNDEAAHGRHVMDSPDAEAPGAWVHEALDRLSPADREVLRLAAWEELDAGQIAVVLGCGRRAAAMRLHRARRRLRAEIDGLRPAAPPTGTPPEHGSHTRAPEDVSYPGDRPPPDAPADGPLPGHRTPAARPAPGTPHDQRPASGASTDEPPPAQRPPAGGPADGSLPAQPVSAGMPTDMSCPQRTLAGGPADGSLSAQPVSAGMPTDMSCSAQRTPAGRPVDESPPARRTSAGRPADGSLPARPVSHGTPTDVSPSGRRVPSEVSAAASPVGRTPGDGRRSADPTGADAETSAGDGDPGRRSPRPGSAAPAGAPLCKDPRHA